MVVECLPWRVWMYVRDPYKLGTYVYLVVICGM